MARNILSLVFLLCVIPLDTSSKYDPSNVCDGVCWYCSYNYCKKCLQKMCIEDVLVFKENCCYRIAKDDMIDECRRICFPEEDVKEKLQIMTKRMDNTSMQLEETTKQLQEMTKKLVNTSMQLEETTKQLKTRDGEIEKLKEIVIELNESGRNDVRARNETDKKAVHTDCDFPVLWIVAVVCFGVIVTVLVVVWQQKKEVSRLIVWIREKKTGLAFSSYEQFQPCSTMFKKLRQDSDKKTETYSNDDELKPLKTSVENESEDNNEIDETNIESNHSDVTKEQQTNDVTVRAQVHRPNNYDTNDKAENKISLNNCKIAEKNKIDKTENETNLDSSNIGEKNVNDKEENETSFDNSNTAEENTIKKAENETSFDNSNTAEENTIEKAENENDHAGNVHMQENPQNSAQERNDNAIHNESCDTSPFAADKCYDAEIVKQDVDHCIVNMPTCSELGRPALDGIMHQCGEPAQKDEWALNNEPTITPVHHGYTDEEEQTETGIHEAEGTWTSLRKAPLKVVIKDEKIPKEEIYSKSNTRPSESKDQI